MDFTPARVQDIATGTEAPFSLISGASSLTSRLSTGRRPPYAFITSASVAASNACFVNARAAPGHTPAAASNPATIHRKTFIAHSQSLVDVSTRTLDPMS
jgi:hypothetical protein